MIKRHWAIAGPAVKYSIPTNGSNNGAPMNAVQWGQVQTQQKHT